MASPIVTRYCRLVSFGCLCALPFCAQLAWSADTKPAKTNPIEANFMYLDKNGDGKLSQQEFPNAQEFTAVDVNNDGFITLDEMRQNAEKRKPPVSIEERFKRMDKNGDGSITMEEMKPLEKPKQPALVEGRFKQLDKNGDGKLSKQEFPKRFETVDGNQDGFVTFDEFTKIAEPTPEERFKQMDKDGDGKLSPKEFPNAKKFAAIDANKDGFITLDEMKPATEKPKEPVAVEGRFKQMDKDGDGKLSPQEFPNAKNFAAADANRDGSVTLDEMKQFTGKQKPPVSIEERFKQMDINGNGSITLEEMKQSIDQEKIEGRFKQLDKNGDGKLSKEEFPNAKRFDAVDANHDGSITIDELEQQKENPQPRAKN